MTVSVTKPIRYKIRECRSCGQPLASNRRAGYCSGACRQAAFRARQRGDPQALFDRWCELIEPICRLNRVLQESDRIERTLWVKHAIDPHKKLEEIERASARRRGRA